MLKIDLNHVLEQIVRHELLGSNSARPEYQDSALYIHFDLRMMYNAQKSYSQSRGLHLLYHTHPGSSTVTVFSAVTLSPAAKIADVKEWKHEVSHDSCWTERGFLAKIYFDMAGEINSAMRRNGLAEVAPQDMHEYHNFSLFSDHLWQWLPVKITKDPSDDSKYRRMIELLQVSR